jgi:hypothetical protein
LFTSIKAGAAECKNNRLKKSTKESHSELKEQNNSTGLKVSSKISNKQATISLNEVDRREMSLLETIIEPAHPPKD